MFTSFRTGSVSALSSLSVRDRFFAGGLHAFESAFESVSVVVVWVVVAAAVVVVVVAGGRDLLSDGGCEGLLLVEFCGDCMRGE